MQQSRVRRFVWLCLIALSLVALNSAPAYTQSDRRAFPETNKSVTGGFLTYWTSHGGLTQFGYPISNELAEKSEIDGETYTIQYFERAVFEYHPENQPPNDVLLSLLGVSRYHTKYPTGAPAQMPNQEAGSILFTETGKRVGPKFYQYWLTHGGLAQQGYPISDEFAEVSELDGKTYLVQYFERAIFEYHPENPAPNNILLSQIGTFLYKARYTAGGQPIQGGSAPPTNAGGNGGTIPTQPQPGASTTQALVTRVIDGDTIEVSIGGALYKVRYIGIDTPETVDPNRPVQCYGKEASDANKTIVAGKTVTLEKDVSEVDVYGRLLRYVYVGGTFVNAELVRQGYAHAATYPPDVRYSSLFVSLEQEARGARRGLWGAACTPTPSRTVAPPTAIVVPTQITPNPPPTYPAPPTYPPAPTPRPNPTSPPSGGGVCGTPYDPHGPDRDCSDFSSQAQAQCFFEAAGGPERDPHRLDADHDGIACESLP